MFDYHDIYWGEDFSSFTFDQQIFLLYSHLIHFESIKAFDFMVFDGIMIICLLKITFCDF